MNKKIMRKLLAMTLAITLTFANFVFLAEGVGKSYAVNVNYEQQGTEVNKTDVSFDAYFISGQGVKSHTQVTEMNNSELKLFLSVSVTKGYLKDAVVSIRDANFKLVNAGELPNGVEAIDTENGTIILNQINKGEAKEIELPIEVVKDERFNLNNFSKDAEVKLTGTFINNSAKEIKAEKAVIVNLALSEEATNELSARIYKYSNFEEEGAKKALLQISVTSKVENNLLPVKATRIDMKIPKLFGEMPENINVVSASMMATNGDNGTAFNENNYTCTEDAITITTSNEPNEEGYVAWVKNSTDEYIVNLVYSLENLETEINEENSKVELTVDSKLSLYNNEEKEISKVVSGELALPEASSSVVSYAISNQSSEIAKGYMLVKDAPNTEYKQEIKVNIGHNPTVNNIEINKDREYYTDNEGYIYTAKTYYNKISINRENLIKILGEDGEVNIISDGEILEILNKDITSYTFDREISDIIIKTTKPIANGVLNIETDKYIKSAEYSERTINELNKLTTAIIGMANEIREGVSTEIGLVQPTLRVVSEISNSNLSTVLENKNVEIKVALQTNNSTNRLFKNPVVEIELPQYVENVHVNTVDLWYNAELKAETGEVSTNAEGRQVIKIILSGEETKFNDIPSVEGTTLIIGADITVDKTAPSITEKMNVRVINNNRETVETNSNITYMAPAGMITLNSVSGFNNDREELTSISGEEKIGKIDVATGSKVATETITVINNYGYTCGEILILGRTPAEGNKSLATQEDLGSTFTAKMVSGIKAIEGVDNENIVIYYSENQNADNDLGNSENGWTTEPANMENIKSYLIVVKTSMVKGDKLVFNYDIEIPEGLSRDESTYGAYQVSYTNLDGALQGMVETVSAPLVGLSTGSGPELEVTVSADVENGQKVKEGDLIEYTVTVKNKGKTAVNNVKVNAEIPYGSAYTTKELDSTAYIYSPDASVKEVNEEISTLAVGESKEIKFFLTVGSKVEYKAEDFVKRENYTTEEDYQNALVEPGLQEMIKRLNSTTVEMVAKAIAYDDEKPIEFISNKMVNEKEKAYIRLDLDIHDGVFKEGGTVTFDLNIKKVSIEDLNNVRIICQIPDGLKFESAVYNKEKFEQLIAATTATQIIWKTDKLTSGDTMQITFKIDEVKEDKEIPLKVQATFDGYNGAIDSNVETISLGIPKLEISHSSNNTVGRLTEGDEIVYTIAVKNVGKGTAFNTKIASTVTDGLFLKTLKYTVNDESETYEISGTGCTFTRNIRPDQTLILEITARANELLDSETEKKVSNQFELTADDINKISSKPIEHTVVKKQYNIDDNNNNAITETVSISGLAWLDANANGVREPDEQRLPLIPVVLINEKGKTISSGMTDENGAYIFENLEPGKYIVAFLYDMGNYDVTTYGKEQGTTNSDAVTMNVNIDGIDTACAATNVITLSSNLYNIDLGLVESKKFDLSLTKTISKITVQTSNGTTTKTYDNSTLEKVEIPSKYLQGATVAVEYTITVKNMGAIAGYASRIVDYLSNTDLKFNSETNADWYLGTDGNLYNSTLGGKLLQPGESATLKLVLTKKVTENNTGITSNRAEIYEAYNDEGVKDYNSTPANKAQNENDLGQADIIIGPKTGVVMYTGVTIVLVSIMIVGIYIINKKVIQNM